MGKEIASRLRQMRLVPRHTRRRKQIADCAAFGDRLDSGLPNRQTTTPSGAMPHYTGKPNVPGLGYAFLFRNYRASLGKWQTADPMGYPDGWNRLAYCGNEVATAVDLWGCIFGWGDKEIVEMNDTNIMTETKVLHTLKVKCHHPHEKSFTYNPAAGLKFTFSGSITLWGIAIAWSYEYTPESMVVDIPDYTCDAKKHYYSHPGELEYNIVLEVDIKLIAYKYDDGSTSCSTVYVDRRLVIEDIKVTQCQE